MANVTYNKQFTKKENQINLQVEEGKSLSDIVESLGCPKELMHALNVSINGDYVPQKYWAKVRPKQASRVNVLMIPQGGSGSDLLKMVAAVAIVVVSQGAGAAFAGGSLATATGTAFWGGLAVTAGVSVAGFLAMNAIFPPPEAATSGSSTEGSSLKTITGSKNASRLNRSVVRIYGENKVYPPFGAQPYTVSEAGKQVLYMLFDFGYGPLEISDLKIGNTPVAEIPNLAYMFHSDINDPSQLAWFSQDIDTLPINVQLEPLGATISRTTSNSLRFCTLDFSFQAGLYAFNSSGNEIDETATVRISVADESGLPVPTAGFSISTDSLPKATINIINQTTYYDVQITSRSKDGFSFGVQVETVADDDFVTVSVNRLANSENGTSQVSNMAYSLIRTHKATEAFRGFRSDVNTGLPVVHSMLELRVQATDQLSGVIDSFNCIAKSVLRSHNGVGFVAPATTSNPAWIYADILTGSMNQRAKNDLRINWTEISAWAARCDELVNGRPRHTCNFILDYDTTLIRLLKDVASCGRATIDIFDDYYSVIYEKPQTQKLQIFTDMNTWDFSSTKTYLKMPHAIVISFRDSENGYEQGERVIYSDGYNAGNSYVFENIQAPMVTNSDEAFRLGYYWLKQAQLRQETITISCDLDWLESKRGDLVGLQKATMKAGGSVARVKAVNGTVVTLTEAANLNNASVGRFELRPTNGNIINGPVAFFHVDSPYEVDIGVAGASVGDLIVLNETGKTTYDCLIKQIDANPDMSATVTLIQHAPEVLNADNMLIPAYDSGIQYGFNPSNPPPILESLSAEEIITVINNRPYATITLTWSAGNGIQPTYYNIFKQDTDSGDWELQGNTSLTRFDWGREVLVIDNPIVGQSHNFAVVGVNDVGQSLSPENGRQTSILIKGDTAVPPAPDYFVVEDTAENFRRFWWGFRDTQPPEGLDGFMIRYTRSDLLDWSAATPLHDGVLVNPPFEIRALPSGAQNVIIKSIKTSKVLSSDSKVIAFGMGERISENVLFTKDWASDGWLVDGTITFGTTSDPSVHVDVSNRLVPDTSLTGNFWSSNDTQLMWTNDSALMWAAYNEAYRWVGNVVVPADGVTTLDWVGDGEVRLYYAKGSYPESFIGKPLGVESSSGIITDGTVEGFRTITDASTIGYHNVIHTLNEVPIAGLTYVASVEVLKDSDQSRLVMLRLGYFNTSGTFYVLLKDITLNTATGGIGGDPNFHIHTIEDHGTYWRISCIVDAQVSDGVRAELYPAISIVGGGYDVNVTGSCEIRNLSLSVAQDLIYAGTDQGIIPYTSPIKLLLGDYVAVVESPSSVDVNRVSSLIWTTDVPDINESFEDVSTDVNGNLTLTLTKPFIAVTAVGLTLQSSGTAVSAEVVSKSSTQVVIKTFNSSHVGAAGLVDVRVQGY